jgi:hypothetical protein
MVFGEFGFGGVGGTRRAGGGTFEGGGFEFGG